MSHGISNDTCYNHHLQRYDDDYSIVTYTVYPSDTRGNNNVIMTSTSFSCHNDVIASCPMGMSIAIYHCCFYDDRVSDIIIVTYDDNPIWISMLSILDCYYLMHIVIEYRFYSYRFFLSPLNCI